MLKITFTLEKHLKLLTCIYQFFVCQLLTGYSLSHLRKVAIFYLVFIKNKIIMLSVTKGYMKDLIPMGLQGCISFFDLN